ncbi:M48 family metallopeptidase [Sulfurimonas microaerophilic]|uniref:M48 family metallopeptidase n=1 Tax=Sulfurimonas microaerophilic TaxID=3058392 RepID=UPI002714EFAF|nr:M48 family metallopeptidase [Sulfurimonas sp. hsl 1-7]
MHNTKQYEIELIINPKLKHSYISISKDKKVIVKTPSRSQKYVANILEEKASWIAKKLQQVESIKLLDEAPLHSLEFLQSRVEHYSALMGLQYSQLKFRKMKRRWGSCSSQRVITLNKELLKLEQRLVDYVVVHELAHLTHMNHSKAFHALVEKHLPSSQTLRRELQTIRIG